MAAPRGWSEFDAGRAAERAGAAPAAVVAALALEQAELTGVWAVVAAQHAPERLARAEQMLRPVSRLGSRRRQAQPAEREVSKAPTAAWAAEAAATTVRAAVKPAKPVLAPEWQWPASEA